jgi:glycosyltransferase involved in cell wall biosynthesis
MYPRISVVTVSYNQAEFIEDNIKSVIKQNYPNVEHVVIDAGSTDGTLEILKKYDKYLNWTSEPDNGQSNGLNKGFKKTTGEIISWINSDDNLASGSLHKIADFFQKNPDEIAVIGDQAIIDEQGDLLHVIKSRAYDFDYLLNHAKGITQNSTFFKRDVFEKIGYLDESLDYAMDRDLFIRIASIKNMPYISETLSEFRMQPNAKTAEGSYKFAKELLKIRKKYGGKFMSPAGKNDLYIIFTQPLRQIKWLRSLVQRFRS